MSYLELKVAMEAVLKYARAMTQTSTLERIGEMETKTWRKKKFGLKLNLELEIGLYDLFITNINMF